MLKQNISQNIRKLLGQNMYENVRISSKDKMYLKILEYLVKTKYISKQKNIL